MSTIRARSWQVCSLRAFTYPLTVYKDNIAPPVAACLGDLVTLCLLGVISTAYLYIIDTIFPILIVTGLIVSAVFWTFSTRKNPHVSDLLTQGWVPLFVAMIISCGTGIVLDLFASRYEGFALLAVVISGQSLFVSTSTGLTIPRRPSRKCGIYFCVSTFNSLPFGSSIFTARLFG